MPKIDSIVSVPTFGDFDIPLRGIKFWKAVIVRS